jgi:hypothetical protein
MDAKRNQVILNNCDKNRWNQYQQDEPMKRVWAKLKPQLIIDLLDKSSGTARHASREVLLRMETHKDNWQIRVTAHQGGTGDARGADDNLHITLKAGGIKFHLRLKEKPSLHIIQVTR